MRSLKLSQASTRGSGTTRELWYAIGTVHDFEADPFTDGRSFNLSVFSAHTAQLAIIFLWASIPLAQINWQGSFHEWCQHPGRLVVSHAIRDPHLKRVSDSAILTTSGVYEWYYTIGLRTESQCLRASSFLILLAFICMAATVIHGISTLSLSPAQGTSLDAMLSHHLSGFIGLSSIAWAGHLIHVALPASRGYQTGWLQLLSTVAHPLGLAPLSSLSWATYAKLPDGWDHSFGSSDSSAGVAILTFVGSRLPSSDSLTLSD